MKNYLTNQEYKFVYERVVRFCLDFLINKNGIHIHSVSIVFLTKLEEGQVKGSNQDHKIEYFKDIPQKIHPAYGKFLKDNWHVIGK